MTHQNRDPNKGLRLSTKGLQTKKRKLGLTLKKKGTQDKTPNVSSRTNLGNSKKNDIIVIEDSPEKKQPSKRQRTEECCVEKDELVPRNGHRAIFEKQIYFSENGINQRKSLKSNASESQNDPWRLMVAMVSSSLPDINDYKPLPVSSTEEEKEDSCKVKPALPSETFVYQDLPEGCAECLCRQMRPLITYSPPKHGKPLSEIFSDVRKSLRRAGFPSGNYLSKQNSTATSSTKTSLSGLQTSASISHYREEELLVNELADSRNSLEREKPSNKIDLSKEESLLLHHDHLESWRSNLFNSRKLLGKNELPQKRSVPKKNGLVSSEFGKDMKLDRNRSTTYAEDFTINEKTSCDSINLDVLPDNIDLDSDLNDLISSMPDIGIVSNSRDECAFGKNRNISGSDSESRSGHSLSKEKSKAKDFYSGDSCSTDAILHSQKQQSLLFSSVIDSFSEKKDNWTLDSGSSVKIQTKQSNTLPNSSLQLRKDHYHTSAVRSDRPLNHSAAPTTAKSCKGDTNDRLFPQNASFGSSNSRPANKVSVPSNGQEIEYQCQSKKLSARFGNSSVFIDNSSPNSFTRNRTKIDKEKESSNFRTESVRSTITRQDQTRVYGTNEYHKASSSLFSQNSSKGLTMHKHESFRHNDQKVSSILPQASASKHSEVNAPKQVFKPVISENYANSMRGPSKGLYTSGTKYKHVKPAYPTAKHSISDKYSSSHNIKSKTICPSYQPNSRLDFNTSTSLLKTGVKGDSKPLCTSFSGNQDSSGSISKKQNTLYGVASKNDENDTGRLLEQCPVCMMNFPLSFTKEQRNEHINMCLPEEIVLDADNAFFEEVELI